MKLTKNTENGGFIKLIILLIVILVVAGIYGFSPQHVWTNYLAPIFIFIWNVIAALAGFMVKALKAGWGAFNYLVGFVHN